MITNTSITPFSFEGMEVRALADEQGNPLFNAKDVARTLGYANTHDAIRRHCKGVVKRYPLQTPGGIQQVRFINEGNLYRLIAGSALPAAEKFETWIFDEVIPQIRKTGGYIPASESPEETMARAILIAQETIKEQKKQLEAQKHKVIFADSVSVADDCILVGDLAKLVRGNGIDIGQQRLFAWMRETGYLMRKRGKSWNMPTQKAMDLHLFEIKERTINQPDGTTRTTRTSMVTGKGQIYFINKFLNQTKFEGME